MRINNKFLLTWFKDHITILLFTILLIFNFLLRVDAFRQPYYYDFQDWSRFYLTAHHIVRFGEFPLVPLEGGGAGVPLGTIIGSPFYSYFLAAQLLLKDDILFLGWVNLFLQIVNLILIYLLAKYLFGKSTAFIASVIFGFSENILNQSNGVWAPYSMQPFLTLSYLLLLLAYLKNNYVVLLSSIVTFLIASVIHYSALGVIPAYSFLVLIVLKKIRNAKRYYLGTIIIMLFTLILLSFPRFYSSNNFIKETKLFNFGSATASIINIVSSPNEILNSLRFRIEVLLKFFLIQPYQSQIVYFLGISIFIRLIIYFSNIKYNFPKKYYSIILCSTFIQFLLVTTFIKTNYPNNPFPAYYFTPIFGIFIILIAEVINQLLPNKSIFKFAKVIFIVLFIYVVSPQLPYRFSNVIHKLSNDSVKSFFEVSYQKHPAIEAVKTEVTRIKENERKKDFNFFQLRGYRIINGHVYDYNHITDVTLFLTHLEIGLNTKLTETIDSFQPNYKQLGSNEYIILICPSKTQYDNPDKCLDVFLESYSGYKLIKNTYVGNDYRVYLMKSEVQLN